MILINAAALGSRGFTITRETDYWIAVAVAYAGDVNGDGFDDILIGDSVNGYRGTNSGEAYILYGRQDGFQSISLASLTSATGIEIRSAAAGDSAGYAVSSAGDFNGDSIADFIIGAPGSSSGGAHSGKAYVVYGTPGSSGSVDLGMIGSSGGMIIEGAAAQQWVGSDVSWAGDVNGDGFDDVVIAGYGANDTGKTYIIYGRPGEGETLTVDQVTASEGFVLTGRTVKTVSGAGDVNGDGLDDFIVGTPNAYGPETLGDAYVIFGKTNQVTPINLNSLLPGDGFMIRQQTRGDSTGRDVSAAGDVNGDGFDDVIISGISRYSTASAYILFGKADGFKTIETSSLSSADGFALFTSHSSYDRAGYSVSSAGDVNGDGLDDVIVGAFSDSSGGNYAGRAYVVYGRTATTPIDLSKLANSEGFVIQSDAVSRVGMTVSSAGDMNGDGFDEVLVSDTVGSHVIFGLAPVGSVSRTGSAASQTLAGGDLADQLDGAGGDDRLYGNGGADVLIGGLGDDWLNGGWGDDDASGGLGNDVYIVDSASDLVHESAGHGIDQVRASVTITLGLNLENLVLTGTSSLVGTGNGLNNLIVGNAAANNLTGLGGNDTLDGGTGADTLNGGDGNDTYVVDNVLDKIVESSTGGLDAIKASVTYSLGALHVESLTLTGLASINGTGNALANKLAGNGAANVLNGGAGADTMYGGNGDDTYIVDNAADAAIEVNSAGGIDTVQSSVSMGLRANVENLVLGGSALTGTGNALANKMIGNAANNVLDGGAGADILYGGLGDDTYVVGSPKDQVIEGTGAGGVDVVQSTVSFALGVNLENLTLAGAAAVNAAGNALANKLIGNAAANVLNGNGGADLMYGGLGNDIYIVDSAGDRVIEGAAAGGSDEVRSSVSFTLESGFENLVLTGLEPIKGIGNALANRITGNAGANALSGMEGDDTLVAGGGRDMMNGGAGTDRLYGGAGADTLAGGTGADGFFFDAPLNGGTDVDLIKDFAVADDTIFLDRAVFGGIQMSGELAAHAFHAGTAATQDSQRILYDQISGKIFYDADGSGTVAAILVAQVSAGTMLTSADFSAYGLA